jgi:stage II sporulation protein AA (anti-sigma F factor antagonist)
VEDVCIHVDRFHVDSIVVVMVEGDVAVDTADTLRNALDQIEPDQHVVVDCSGVAFMDSTGLEVLLVQSRRMRHSGGWLHVRHASPQVLRIVEITGLGKLIEPRPPDPAVTCSWIPPDSF